MSEGGEQETARRRRLRWINLGEAIAIAALVISGLGLWHQWSKDDDKPPPTTTTVVEKRQSIPLVLRGKAIDDGRALQISPVESSHALESLTLTIGTASPIEIGSDGRLTADAVEDALKDRDEDKGTHSVPVRIATRYVEAGADKRSSGSYTLRYRWDGGGLFGGRSLRLISLSRA